MELGDGGGDKPGDSGGEKRDIRRPMNAFLIFCKRHRSMVREKHPDRDNRSVTRILGDLWANLAEDEKAVYTNLAKQYKDAFMKANPDYKWHSTDRLPQPAKMATRPTNVRPARSLSTSECSAGDQSSEGDKLAGLNLLLMAGQQSMPARDKQAIMAHVLERRMTSPDLMGANSALLQLAEMCSSELRSRQTDTSMMHSAPPKKRARHWSYSDCGHSDIADRSKISATSLLFPPIPNPSLKPHQPSATKTSQSEDTVQTVDHLHLTDIQSGAALQMQDKTKQQQQHVKLLTNQMVTDTKDFHTAPALARKEEPGQADPGMAGSGTDLFQSHLRMASADASMPPKKKFTKLQESLKHDRQAGQSPAVAAPAESGCLSDQNDNAIFTCGKLVVDHIIDRLFSASFVAGEQSEATAGPSSTDIEKVRKIITADMTERERKAQGAPSTQMGRLLSEVVHKPQNLVEKVIEEAYSMDLNQMAQLEPAPRAEPPGERKPELNPVGRSLHRAVVSGKLEACLGQLPPISENSGPEVGRWTGVEEHKQATLKSAPSTMSSDARAVSGSDVPTDAPPKPHLPSQPVLKDEVEDRYSDEMMADSAKDDGGDFMQDDDDGYSQPVRKSRRRNRGQRYQELINEGIIQPSKERLAARRHEQVPQIPAGGSISIFSGEDRREEEGVAVEDRLRFHLKRSISESDSSASDEKRYRTGDFDLEAEIATLPPCSLDQVGRRRPPRKRSDSESGRKQPSPASAQGGPSSPSEAKEENGVPESAAPTSAPPQQAAANEPLTGSQKRKARKHSINRLVASTESGCNTKPQGIAASIPMVRDATVSPTPDAQPQPTSEASTPAPAPTTTSCKSATGSAPPLNCPDSATTRHSNAEPSQAMEVKPSEEATSNLERDGRLAGSPVRTLKTQSGEVSKEQPHLLGATMDLPMAEWKNSVEISASVSGHLLTDLKKKGPGFVQKGSDCASANTSEQLESVPAKAKNDACDSSLEGNKCADKGSRLRRGEEEKSVVKAEGCDGDAAGRVVNDSPGGAGVVFNVAEGLQKRFRGDSGPERSNDLMQGGAEPVVRFDDQKRLRGPAQCSSATEDGSGEFKVSLKSQQLKENLSRECGLGEDLNPDPTRATNKPPVFLSETSGLICVAMDVNAEVLPSTTGAKKEWTVKGDSRAEKTDSTLGGVKSRPRLAFDSGTEKAESHSVESKFSLLTEEENEQSTACSFTPSSVSRSSPVAEETADSLDGGGGGNRVIVTVSSSGCFTSTDMDVSPFSSGANPAAGACVTTVSVTTTDALPTALSLEMMKEGGVVDSGVANPMLRASPLPGSPSVTVVHS